MKQLLPTIMFAAQVAFSSWTALAHPGSGIVVDEQGQVFFQDTVARTIWRIDAHSKVTSYYNKLGGHWMTLDIKNRFAASDLKVVERIPVSGNAPVLLVADGGAPVTVSADGYLFYGLEVSESGNVSVGLMRISPSGSGETFAPGFAQAIEQLGITGLASGPDGTVYVACLTAVMKVRTNGTFSTLINPVVVTNCDEDAATCFLRGLDVDSRGTVYAAACGCRCVVKITTDGRVETVLKAERPWSPTGVAVHRDDVFVLEYTNPNGGADEGWRPRVRRLGRDGRVTTLVTISEAQQNAQPNRVNLERKGQ